MSGRLCKKVARTRGAGCISDGDENLNRPYGARERVDFLRRVKSRRKKSFKKDSFV